MKLSLPRVVVEWRKSTLVRDMWKRLPDFATNVEVSAAYVEAWRRRRWLLLSFVLFVGFPASVAAAYLGAVASNEYVAEARVVVRSGTVDQVQQAVSGAASLLKSLGASQAATQQDSYIVANYIMGRSIIDDLGGRSMMNAIYSRPGVDWLSRLPRDSDFESIWKYWQHKVSAVLDVPSGIVILQVRAFTREDAQRLAERIVVASENLVNAMSARARRDTLDRAQAEFTTAKQHVEDRQKDLLTFRNAQQLLDPVLSAGSVSEVLTGLIRDKLMVENELSSLASSMSEDAPNRRILRSRLQILDQQIEKLRAELTSRSADTALAAQLAKYQELQLEVRFSERLYEIAGSVLARAHQDVEKQHLYLFTVVRPTKPGRALYPRPLTDAPLILLWATILWTVGALTIAGIRDHA